jgi:hypothetical protein
MSKKYMTFFTQVDDNTTPWYLAGGVAAANCVAAYLAKGAADYATSKVNLANPGTHDLTDGAVAPAFDAATGWTFDGATTYLVTDLSTVDIGKQTGSIIIRCFTESATQQVLVGAYTEVGDHYTELWLYVSLTVTGVDYGRYHYFSYTTGGTSATYTSSGGDGNIVICGAGNKLYMNGLDTGEVCDPYENLEDESPDLWIGVTNYVPPADFSALFNGELYCLAFYNSILTSDQIAAITTAMQAL